MELEALSIIENANVTASPQLSQKYMEAVIEQYPNDITPAFLVLARMVDRRNAGNTNALEQIKTLVKELS